MNTRLFGSARLADISVRGEPNKYARTKWVSLTELLLFSLLHYSTIARAAARLTVYLAGEALAKLGREDYVSAYMDWSTRKTVYGAACSKEEKNVRHKLVWFFF